MQDGLAARKDVETHLNNLLFLNAIERYIFLLPKLLCDDPVQHCEVELEVEVLVVVEVHRKDPLLAILITDAFKLFHVQFSTLAKGMPLKIVVMLPLLFEPLVF